MAKTQGGLLSETASGTFGKALTFHRQGHRGNRQVVGIHRRRQFQPNPNRDFFPFFRRQNYLVCAHMYQFIKKGGMGLTEHVQTGVLVDYYEIMQVQARRFGKDNVFNWLLTDRVSNVITQCTTFMWQNAAPPDYESPICFGAFEGAIPASAGRPAPLVLRENLNEQKRTVPLSFLYGIFSIFPIIWGYARPWFYCNLDGYQFGVNFYDLQEKGKKVGLEVRRKNADEYAEVDRQVREKLQAAKEDIAARFLIGGG